MMRCPEEYCCEAEDEDEDEERRACSSYDECAEGRHGPLCALCEPGYSLSLNGEECVEESQCGAMAPFILTAVVLCLVFGIMLVVRAHSVLHESGVASEKANSSPVSPENILGDEDSPFSARRDSDSSAGSGPESGIVLSATAILGESFESFVLW